MAEELQKPEISQIRRIAGQIRGVEKLISQEAKTSKILQQIEAARGNLKALEKRILSPITKKLKDQEDEKSLAYLMKIS